MKFYCVVLADCADKTPGCVDINHTPSYGLDKEGRAQVSRERLVVVSVDINHTPLMGLTKRAEPRLVEKDWL